MNLRHGRGPRAKVTTCAKRVTRQKNVQNVLGILLKTILKFRNNRFYKNFYSKNRRIYKKIIHCSGVFEEKIDIDNTSENIKCGNL